MLRTDPDSTLTRLSLNVRYFSLSQASKALGSENGACSRVVERRLKRLADEGWLTRSVVFVRPLLDLVAGPLTEWRPGQPEPDYDRLAWVCRKRWTAPPDEMCVWQAGRAVLSLAARTGTGTVRQGEQLTHDLHVTQVFVELMARRPGDAAGWVGEDQLGRPRRGKVPDAVLVHDGQVRTAIDFAGSYPAARLRATGKFFIGLGLPFELW